jgi:hypothetical protein
MIIKNNEMYDRLKFIAQIVLPGLATLYFALAGIWGFPYGEQIVGTIAAIDAFLGAILQISSDNYYREGKDFAGTLVVDTQAETGDFDFNVDNIADLASQKQVKVKVESYEGKHEA